MKKLILSGILTLSVPLTLMGCGTPNKTVDPITNNAEYMRSDTMLEAMNEDMKNIDNDDANETVIPANVENPDDTQLPQQTDNEIPPSDIPRAVFVEGALYIDSGRESTAMGRCGNMDGEITSTVIGNELPFIEGQSNFGTDFGYQYGRNITSIEVNIDDKWEIFEREADNPLGIFLDAQDIERDGMTLVCIQHGGNIEGELETGEYYTLEKKNGDSWEAVPTILDEYGWNDIALLITPEGQTEWDIAWEWLYGKLDEGKYRLGKEVMDFVDGREYEKQAKCVVYAYFRIENWQ